MRILWPRSHHLLKSSLKLANIYVNDRDRQEKLRRFFLTSATKQKGIAAEVEHILGGDESTNLLKLSGKRIHRFEKMGQKEYGNWRFQFSFT